MVYQKKKKSYTIRFIPTNICSINAWEVASFHRTHFAEFQSSVYEFKQSVWEQWEQLGDLICPTFEGLKIISIGKGHSIKEILKASVLHGVEPFWF